MAWATHLKETKGVASHVACFGVVLLSDPWVQLEPDTAGVNILKMKPEERAWAYKEPRGLAK